MIYLDASALVTLLARRTYAKEMRDFLNSRPLMPMATSSLGFVETVRTMDRIGDYPDLMRDLVQGFTEILLTEEIRDAAAHLRGGLRTLDAVHVASAQLLGDSLDTLITYDKRMLDVARAEGLPAEAPGLL
ncbi:type II toxin-antitoxin system VapC family toxin [Actinoplanes solisilvae]|uniref:type II toxin-antitoxin system VapC family toxin n=1 Tax=Actinoplanes solisilvae TaxID=2486853 RepID=UPI000FDB6EC0|nr:type II toxin-antitoxin system VapC family toxin [Actinoplanes solisilvae]